eukprot:10480883-Alexandrium_andersonii.AAC.1
MSASSQTQGLLRSATTGNHLGGAPRAPKRSRSAPPTRGRPRARRRRRRRARRLPGQRTRRVSSE